MRLDAAKPRVVSNWPDPTWWVRLPTAASWRVVRTWAEAIELVANWYATKRAER